MSRGNGTDSNGVLSSDRAAQANLIRAGRVQAAHWRRRRRGERAVEKDHRGPDRLGRVLDEQTLPLGFARVSLAGEEAP